MPKLLDQVRTVLRVRRYSYRTEKTYVQWIRQYIFFHNVKHPKDMGATEIEAFLTHLAVERTVSAATQNQALAALLFLYREVLSVDLPWLEKFMPARKSSSFKIASKCANSHGISFRFSVSIIDFIHITFELYANPALCVVRLDVLSTLKSVMGRPILKYFFDNVGLVCLHLTS